jgi:hypothetical protein
VRLGVAARRELLETVLCAVQKLEGAQGIVDSFTMSTDTTYTTDVNTAAVGGGVGAVQRGGRRSRLLAAAEVRLQMAAPAQAQLQIQAQTQAQAQVTQGFVGGGGSGGEEYALLLLQRDVLACSELERACFCLSAADTAVRQVGAVLQGKTVNMRLYN